MLLFGGSRGGPWCPSFVCFDEMAAVTWIAQPAADKKLLNLCEFKPWWLELEFCTWLQMEWQKLRRKPHQYYWGRNTFWRRRKWERSRLCRRKRKLTITIRRNRVWELWFELISNVKNSKTWGKREIAAVWFKKYKVVYRRESIVWVWLCPRFSDSNTTHAFSDTENRSK